MKLVIIATSMLLLLGAGQAAPARFAVDVPLLDLYPASTVPGKTATTEADIYMPASTEMAKVSLFLPAGYGNVLGRANGAVVGTAFAYDPSFDPLIGPIVAADPSQYAANACAAGMHQAVWLLMLGEGLPQVPVLIDATSGPDAALGAYKAQFCLPPSSSGTIKVRELDLRITKLVNPTATGVYKWRAFVTPYKNSVPNDPGTFEVRGTISMPMSLTMHARYDRSHKRAILTGRLVVTGYDVTGVYLDLYKSSRYWGSTQVNRRGFFTIKRRLKKTARFQIWTSNYDDACNGSPAPAGCPSDALANIPSKVVKVVVPKR